MTTKAVNLARQLVAKRQGKFYEEMMTTEFKMPEPVATVDCKEVHGHPCQYLNRTRFGMDTLLHGDHLYKAADMRAVIEQCAAECEQAKDLYDASTLYDHVPGILQIRADRIRELLEKVK